MGHLESLEDVKVEGRYIFRPQQDDAKGLGKQLKAVIGSVIAVSRITNDEDIWIYDPKGGSEIDEPVYHYELYPLIQDWDS